MNNNSNYEIGKIYEVFVLGENDTSKLINKVNNTQFYRGIRGENSDNLKGPQYFSSVESFAKTYGPVSPHRINLKNPKFVDNDEWSDYASSPFESSIDIAKKVKNMGYDSVVNIRSIPNGEMITVFVVDGNSTKA